MRTVDATPFPGGWVHQGPPVALPTDTRGWIHSMRVAWRQRDRGLAGLIERAELGRETGARC